MVSKIFQNNPLHHLLKVQNMPWEQFFLLLLSHERGSALFTVNCTLMKRIGVNVLIWKWNYNYMELHLQNSAFHAFFVLFWLFWLWFFFSFCVGQVGHNSICLMSVWTWQIVWCFNGHQTTTKTKRDAVGSCWHSSETLNNLKKHNFLHLALELV